MIEKTWGSVLHTGLMLERRGRLKEAEDAILNAARLAPEAALPQVELARLLSNGGRLQEALLHLRRALALGNLSSTAYLTAGRIFEKKGWFKQAEAVFLKAVRLASAKGGRHEAAERRERLREAHMALGELHDKMGRLSEAREDFLRAAELDSGSVWCFVGLGGVLRKLGDLKGARSALKKALKLSPELGEARVKLVQVLIDDGDRAEAIKQVLGLLASPGAVSSDQFTDCVAGLVGAGAYEDIASPLHRYLRRVGGGPGWSKVFSVVLCEGRYREAGRLGEAMLDGFLERAPACELTGLLWPWSDKVRSGVAEARFCEEQLALIAATAQEGDITHWFAYWRCRLLLAVSRFQEALTEQELIGSLPPARYFWMRLPLVLIKLHLADFTGAVSECRIILQYRPDLWLVRCHMAEALLAQGQRSRALDELGRAEAIAEQAGDLRSKREVLTWHGEVLLWLGRYEQALRKLDEALALGAETFVHGWRGAALLKLGRLKEAVADLDRAVAHDGKDFEALVWRGEAKRMLGLHREALEDLDLAAAPYSSGNTWVLCNRALVKLALGDESGMRADFDAIPDQVLRFVRRKSGQDGTGPLTSAQIKEVLLRGLELGKGIRRMEKYLDFWMNP